MNDPPMIPLKKMRKLKIVAAISRVKPTPNAF